MWREARRRPKPSDTFYNLSNSFFIILWTLFPPRVPGCRSSLFGPHKWSFEFKIEQDLARVFSVWGPSCLSWMDLGSRSKFIFFFSTCSEINISKHSLWWIFSQLKCQPFIFQCGFSWVTPQIPVFPTAALNEINSIYLIFCWITVSSSDHCFSPPMCLLDAPQGQI